MCAHTHTHGRRGWRSSVFLAGIGRFTLARVQGTPVKLGGGNVTVVEFWATWCVSTTVLQWRSAPMFQHNYAAIPLCSNVSACFDSFVW